jgi:hypothetical protein
MTSEEIRALGQKVGGNLSERMLVEIAAQLAELNERVKRIDEALFEGGELRTIKTTSIGGSQT